MTPPTESVCRPPNHFLHSRRLRKWLYYCAVVATECCAFAAPRHFAATNLWQAEVGHFNLSSPAMDRQGVLYVTSWNGRVYAVNPDGTRRWVFKVGFESVSSPAIGDDGTIFFGSR